MPNGCWLALGLACGLLLLAMLKMRSDPLNAKAAKVHERKHHSTSTIERFLAWVKPPQHAVAFGHIVASFRWLPHIICFGAPGSGKSSYLQALILDRPIGLPALIAGARTMAHPWCMAAPKAPWQVNCHGQFLSPFPGRRPVAD